MTQTKAVLLVNLGSPKSPKEDDVRAYLDEFLMDPYVIDYPFWLRWLVVKGIILRTRPKQSAKAYASVWTDNGSPLIHISQDVRDLLQEQSDLPIFLGMRYASPSLESVIDTMLSQYPTLTDLLVIPLYPHYAMSTTLTTERHIRSLIKKRGHNLTQSFQAPFYKHPLYIKSLSTQIAESLPQPVEHLLFSYHGLPERHLKKTDCTGSHCLKQKDCCHTPSPAHKVCYAHHIKTTTALVADELRLSQDQFSISFQSRLGRDKWIEPYTDKHVVELAQKGVSHLCVVCPAFVSDCLETIEEIGIELKDIFLNAGGKTFTLIPCLNRHPAWISTLNVFVNDFKKQEFISHV